MQGQSKKLSFKGQHVFIGLDVSKRNWKVCILVNQFEHKTFTQPPRTKDLIRYLHHNFPEAEYHCVYEAGFSGFWAHDQLKEAGVDCIVVNPADVPRTGKEQVNKTDGVDARMLSQNLRDNRLEAIYVPSKDRIEDRALVRMRQLFVRKQTRCKNQIKALMYFYGVTIPEDIGDRHWSRRFIRWIEEISTNRESGKQALDVLLEELMSLRKIISDLNRKIRKLSMEESFREPVRLLRTIPGISTLTAMILMSELINIRRFPSLDELSCYFGLVPGERSSGERQIITGITPRRNVFLRFLIIESSWIAVRKDPALMQAFGGLSRRMPKNRAIIRIARKLLNRVRFVLIHQQPYQNLVVASRT
jgi:transposase